MHKTATRKRSHQLALARANKACAKKTTKKTTAKRAAPKRQTRKMKGLMDRMKAGYQNMKNKMTGGSTASE
jgi:hypothetical protein